ncbi:ClpP/crotonase-like domain-containing protein [Schizophyllum commune]
MVSCAPEDFLDALPLESKSSPTYITSLVIGYYKEELSDSRYTVYDVLLAFFNHKDPMATLAALEVYGRRAYRAYALLSIDYEEGENLDDGDKSNVLAWRSNIGQSHSPPSTPRLTQSRRTASVDLSYLVNRHQSQPRGFKHVASLLPAFDTEEYRERYGKVQPPNALNLALRIFEKEDDMPEDEWATQIAEFVNTNEDELDYRGVRRVSVLICRKGQYPVYLTMRDIDGTWKEEQAIRNIEPALAFQLGLRRLSNYNLKPWFVEAKQIHVHHAVARENQLDQRFFVLFSTRSRWSAPSTALPTSTNTFINFVYNLAVTYDDVLEAVAGFIERHGKHLWRLHVTGSEIGIALEDDEGNITPIRCVIETVAGFVINFHGYQEITTDKGTTVLKSIGEKGPLHLQPVHQAYPRKESLQPKRYRAHLIGTTYVYDFPQLFAKALNNVWLEARKVDPSLTIPKNVLESRELVLDEHDRIAEVDRAPGDNTFGMVGWVYTLRKPKYPSGRRAVVIADDITYKIGSFGPVEDQFFYQVSQYARDQGLPRTYLSANSGARICLAEEIFPLFSVAWNDDAHPEKGIDYLYLTRENFLKVQEKSPGAVRTVEMQAGDQRRHKITDIIGLQDGIGVESLRGSGLIAGQPIILTGAQALNKVLGREVYTSNLQLGGTQIMFKDGVSHLTASSDLQAAQHIMQWLSYISEFKLAPLPIRVNGDAWDRDISYTPPKDPYDPRWFIEGKREESTEELSSSAAHASAASPWVSSLWRRAHDGAHRPRRPSSFEQRIMEAGQVWYPNSAYKTAQAIFNFNRVGLPLIIFANWRGFSGGQQDMYNEIIKQGSKIVDGLSAYKQPVFVYIVPNGELLGGAWVVLDPSINSQQMEVYAGVDARAGILEPGGSIEIKVCRDKILALMERLDPTHAASKKDSKDPSKSELLAPRTARRCSGWAGCFTAFDGGWSCAPTVVSVEEQDGLTAVLIPPRPLFLAPTQP